VAGAPLGSSVRLRSLVLSTIPLPNSAAIDPAQKRARKARHDSFMAQIRVECYAGYRGEEEPRAFTLGETRFAVVDILDRWAGPDHRYFKVRADDGRTFVLRHDTAGHKWELAAMVGVSQ
jgi:hypothetical protein